MNFSTNVKFFLIPNNKDRGNLETLIENIAKEECVLKCFDHYTECLKTLQEKNQNIKLPAKSLKFMHIIIVLVIKMVIKII